MRNREDEPRDEDGRRVGDESAPFGASWAALYAFVLAWLAVLVLLFYLFTRAYR
jgi:hypothetical protein